MPVLRTLVRSKMSANEDDERQGIQSVEIAMTVLEALAAGGGPIPLGEVARRADSQPNKIHRYLVSLCRVGLASQSATSGHYDLGPALRRLGAASLRRSNMVTVASEAAAVLRDETGHAINISVWTDGGPIIVRWDYGAHVLPLDLRVGATLSVLASSAGRVFLAYLPERLTAAALAANGKRAKVDTELRLTLDQVRASGDAYLVGAVIPELSSVSAPVFSAADDLPVVMTLVFPANQVSEREITRIRTALRRTTQSISRELGADAATNPASIFYR